VNALGARLRQLAIPIIGRIEDQGLLLDFRCIEDEAGFIGAIAELAMVERP
jgi:L-seryl-tRNA(Ser) seleniumtransferase